MMPRRLGVVRMAMMQLQEIDALGAARKLLEGVHRMAGIVAEEKGHNVVGMGCTELVENCNAGIACMDCADIVGESSRTGSYVQCRLDSDHSAEDVVMGVGCCMGAADDNHHAAEACPAQPVDDFVHSSYRRKLPWSNSQKRDLEGRLLESCEMLLTLVRIRKIFKLRSEPRCFVCRCQMESACVRPWKEVTRHPERTAIETRTVCKTK